MSHPFASESAFESAPISVPASAGQVAAVWRDRLSLLLESTGEGIFGIDMAGCCVFVNRSAAQMLGWPADVIIGRNLHGLIHHTHADGRHYPEADCPIFKAFRQGQPSRIDDEVFWRADGSTFWAEYSSHPIVEHGQVQGAVVTLVDISARREAEALLRRTNERLESRVAERTAELQASAARLRELANHGETVRETERTRIAREIHDELGSLLVRLWVDEPPDPVLYLSVRDDGVGAPAKALDDARSCGVMGMHERAGHFGGRLSFDSAPGQGTRVRLMSGPDETGGPEPPG